MLRKILEVLGLLESRAIRDVFINPSACETLDSLVVIQAISPRKISGRKQF